MNHLGFDRWLEAIAHCTPSSDWFILTHALTHIRSQFVVIWEIDAVTASSQFVERFMVIWHFRMIWFNFIFPPMILDDFTETANLPCSQKKLSDSQSNECDCCYFCCYSKRALPLLLFLSLCAAGCDARYQKVSLWFLFFRFCRSFVFESHLQWMENNEKKTNGTLLKWGENRRNVNECVCAIACRRKKKRATAARFAMRDPYIKLGARKYGIFSLINRK